MGKPLVELRETFEKEENTDQVDKDRLPYAKFKLMHDIAHKEAIMIELQRFRQIPGEPRECAL